MNRSRGFTVQEVCVILFLGGILASATIPNYINAQAKAKASKAKADLAVIAVALEAYRVDHQQYPFDGGNCTNSPDRPYWFIPWDLTTPSAYCSPEVLNDPFRGWDFGSYTRYRYQNVDSTWGRRYGICTGDTPSSYYDEMLCLVGHWCLHSQGPNKIYGPTGWPNDCGYPQHPWPYDPTNGIISDGNIMVPQGPPDRDRLF